MTAALPTVIYDLISIFFLFYVNLNYNPWKIKFSSSSSSPLALSKYFH